MTPPKIDLSTCQRGDRVRLRDGAIGRYCRPHNDGHLIDFTRNGLAWEYFSNGTAAGAPAYLDVVAILGPSLIERIRRWMRRKGN